jgi:hypothetical protein
MKTDMRGVRAPDTIPYLSRHSIISKEQIAARLALLPPPQRLARKWGYTVDGIQSLLAGRRLYSQLLPKLARMIRVPTPQLRAYLDELHGLREEARARQAA